MWCRIRSKTAKICQKRRKDLELMGAPRRQGRCSDKDSLCGNYEAQWRTTLENPVRDFLCNVILNLKSSTGNITFCAGVQRRHL